MMNQAGTTLSGARRAALAVAITLCLAPTAACGFVGGSSSDKDTLVFGGFGGSLEEAMKSEVIPKFEKEFDVDVTYVTGTSDELMAKARQSSSGIDVIWTNDTTHHDGKAEDLFAELDPETVTNLDSVYDVARDPDDIGIVTGMQALGLNYNTEAYQAEGLKQPTSWKDLTNPRVAGHVVGYNVPIGYANLLLVQFADMNGGGGGNDTMASGTAPNILGGRAGPGTGTGDITIPGSASGVGIRLSATQASSSAGGDSHLGKGGGSRTAQGPGVPGHEYGGGAAGANSRSDQQNGAPGADGIIILELYG